MKREKSNQEFERAKRVIPGGVNSPVRAFKSVQSTPAFISHGKGARIFDIDGNEYIDFVGSWGPLILGHAFPAVIDAIEEAVRKGTSFGAPTVKETDVAELICNMVPSVEKVRMVNSGTEATMSALRLARGFTGREKVIKFAGCYHGHVDSFLIQAGSGALTHSVPDSMGVTRGTASDTLLAEYNNPESVERLFSGNQNKIAAVILEPVAGNMGVVPPAPGFLDRLRKLTQENGALLIFDEVITGFRLSGGGAQEYYDVTPDITTLGKIIGGGLPVGAFGGKKEIMDYLAPEGGVYQAGTLAGNPVSMAAGYAMLKFLNDHPEIYKELEDKGATLEEGIRENLGKTGIPGVVNRVGSMMTLFFSNAGQIYSYKYALTANTAMYAGYFKLAVENGIYIAPSQFESMFVSYAHTREDIEETVAKNLEALRILKNP
ncbi:MAG: glutamate-1-semialdehyde 2,1-aminomutase [Bacteroidales bacterium]|nr:glutamate-1-semialdehyde 2,1-aminomutase [Bacteroidales bacterium]